MATNEQLTLSTEAMATVAQFVMAENGESKNWFDVITIVFS